jgi:hypothetical protein
VHPDNDHPAWRKSTRCGSATCVEVAEVGDRVLVRDSKNPDRASLSFTKLEWDSFQDGLLAGDFPTCLTGLESGLKASPRMNPGDF